MTYDINLPWHSFKVDLPDLDLWLRSNAPGYTGMSGNSSLQIHFVTKPSDNVQALVLQYWGALTESTEAQKINTRLHFDKVVAYATQNLPYASMNTWSPAEIKIFMGHELSLQDKDALAAKYPNI